MDGIEVVLLGDLGQLDLSGRCAEFALHAPSKVLFRAGCHVRLELAAEKLCELCSMLSLFIGGLLPVQADLRIALAVGDAGHAEGHADLRALAAEVGLELVEDELLVLFGNAVELRADAEFMLGRELQIALDDLELLAGNTADRALEAFGQLIAFINITADGADILLHNKILLKCYFCCFRS